PSEVQRGKQRRRHSDDEIESGGKKPKGTRKTAVACNFCRGKKLRCNGARPSCFNCTQRTLRCEYVPVPRRR
ncbi:hypothetical protein BDN72DRAFT_723642, partial [Pluteus cervinus]